MRVIQTISLSRKIFRFVLGVVAILAATVPAVNSHAQAQPADELSEIMKLTGLDVFFDDTDTAISFGFWARFRANPPDSDYRKKVLAAVDRAVQEVYGPARLKRQLRATLEAKLDKADYAAILAFYRSPLGVRITAMENSAHHPESHKRREGTPQRPMKELGKQEERIQVLKALDKATDVSGVEAERVYYTTRAIAIGELAARKQTTNLTSDSIAAIDAKLKEARPEITRSSNRNTWRTRMNTYRDASIEELRQYLEFLSSPVGKRLYAAGEAAINDIYFRAGADFGHALMKALGKERS